MKYIIPLVFVVSFLVGIVYVYLSWEDARKIIIYPTRDNASTFQYVDEANNCFSIEPREVKCPYLDSNVKEIVPQM